MARSSMPITASGPFTSWSFTDEVRQTGLMPSFGSVGDAFDNAMMASFSSTMQIELLDRKRCRTPVDLSAAIVSMTFGPRRS